MCSDSLKRGEAKLLLECACTRCSIQKVVQLVTVLVWGIDKCQVVNLEKLSLVALSMRFRLC